MAKSRNGLTYEEETALLDGIDSGDPDAIREAQRISSQLAKRANVRISAIEESGFKSRALNRARYYLQEDLGRNKFTESKKLEGEELKDHIRILNEFLNDEQGTTVGGLRAQAEESAVEGLQNAGILPEDLESKKKRELMRFLSSDIWKEIKSAYAGTEGGSGGYLVAAIDAIESGQRYKDLERMYEDYKDKTEGDFSVFDVMEDWMEI